MPEEPERQEPERHPCIRRAAELPSRAVVWPDSTEVLSIRTPLSRPLGLVRLGVHHEVLEPGHRSSLPHAESTEEECVYVLEGHPHAWIDDALYPLAPDDIVALGFERELVQRVVTMVQRAEYKRKQSPVGLKVTSLAFGTGRRMPIAAKIH